jgi:alpha-tubulin suppressor-like RCC1 family protein
MWSWGRNTNGQLGDGTSRSSPAQIGALTTWSKVSAGGYFAAAIKTTGALWAWGNNAYGQLGRGNTTQYTSPVQVSGTWSKVSAGGTQTLGIYSNGTLWAWGDNAAGCLGLGDITDRSLPTQVGLLTTWSKIETSATSHTIAIKTDGTLWAWGNNAYGQLGLGNTTSYSSPKQVGALTTWATLAEGVTSCTLAIKTDGTLWAWGRNLNGKLGLGNTTNYSSPKQVGTLTTWATVAGGGLYEFYGFSLAIKTNGTLWSWGQSAVGQLGLGNTTSYSSPKQVGALTAWSKVAAGSESVLAIIT